ncbi:hypothetical protein CC86DRAFT_301580 [Ophiobolus disseminans]|uniref:DUF7730 domain-containing protein n=1 Tax=Ophiobolus disseminans TaxID=1469910 RepID=A0A6A6ZMA6_9PLEO|nr:hypothetical protein CC86DRAFT_301580 [Ophiobolus disseminans]
MTKLPLEVRRMIYERALGGVTIHLQSEKGRPRAKQCPREECTCFYFDPISEKSLSFGLGLLRTCRLVYDEAIEFLYSANTFSLTTEGDELTTVNYLSHYFLPQRLSQIRDLRFHWFLDIAPFVFMLDWLSPSMEPWLRSWDSLSRMTGLRKLHVVLEYRLLSFDEGYKKMWKEKEVELLAAVKTVTAPRHFVVVLPNRRCTTDLDVGPSRCVFRSSEEQQSPDMP